MKKLLAIFIAKLAILAGKLMKRGSSLPGYLALRIDENIGKKLDTSACIKVAITGANGKSTTTTLLAKILEENGFTVAANLKGSNMRPGVFTGILEKTTLFGKVKADIIVMEVDEFSSPKVYSAIQPDFLVTTNVLRDHIERQSDIGNVLKKIEGKLGEDTTLILNADEPIVSQMKYGSKNPRIYYGIDDIAYGHKQASTPLAGKFCLQCGHKLAYSHYFYEHLGHYQCENCGFTRQAPKYAVTALDMENHKMTINQGETYSVNYDAFFMYENVLAAISVARELGISPENIEKVTGSFVMGKARLSEFYLHENKGVMNFLKNATSLTATIDLMAQDKGEKTVALVMDDTYDGRYFITQWYYDSDVEKLAADTTVQCFVCTWKRGYDMAVRLKSAGVPEEKIIVELDMEKAVDILREKAVGNIYLGYDTDSHSIGKVVAALAKYPENSHLKGES